ncbi:MAG TPA: DUF2911 domain-containing protein [Candidatus Acidoferrum sp.]|jgi:hypothetical protein|nr:DUF2911 domain-containing protein [Candidatus Acidoferrum sp.]
MKRNLFKLIGFTAVVASVFSLQAGPSPHETISATIDGNKVTITYGRPYSIKPGTTEVRKIWGGLVPYGKVWRTGADAATVLTTEQPLVLGETTLPAGKYTLFTWPVENGAPKLIINKKTGQWGIPYDEKKEADNELARVDMKQEALDKDVGQFTMAIEPNPSGGGVLKMMWEKTQYSVTFTAKK